MKTEELTGAALDWAVCKARGEHQHPYDEYTPTWMANRRYSEDWAKGGPIIEREKIKVGPQIPSGWGSTVWENNRPISSLGPTPLVAAMRCFVASKLGDEVEVPDALT